MKTNKTNSKLSNSTYTSNLLECARILCDKLGPIYENENVPLEVEDVVATIEDARIVYNSLKTSIRRIVFDENSVCDENQLELELDL